MVAMILYKLENLEITDVFLNESEEYLNMDNASKNRLDNNNLDDRYVENSGA